MVLGHLDIAGIPEQEQEYYMFLTFSCMNVCLEWISWIQTISICYTVLLSLDGTSYDKISIVFLQIKKIFKFEI